MRPKKQENRILAYLKLYKTINPLQGWFRCGVYRLSDVIMKLNKRAGVIIITEKGKGYNKFGEPVRFANYRLLNH